MTVVFPRAVALVLATAGLLPLASCTSTTMSGLNSLSRPTGGTVAKTAETTTENSPSRPESPEEALAAAPSPPTGTAGPGGSIVPASLSTSSSTVGNAAASIPVALTPVSSSEIVMKREAPAQVAPTDPVAVPKPSSSPAVLASVPRTPVSNRPTNQIMMVRTTAYTHSESDHVQYGRKSAAGNTLQYGSQVRSAAADWSKYPLGTRFQIEGMPYEYVVDDYGSALVGTETIDIYKPEKGTMNKWGVRNVPIRVLEWGSFEESRKILDGRKHVRHADHVREMLREIEKKGRNGQAPGVVVPKV